MKSFFILHFFEIILAVIYIVYNWPIYEGEDYLWGVIICIGYILSIAFYCIITSLIPAMRIACDVTKKQYSQWKGILYYNILWCAFAILIVLLFGNSLSFFACLPIVLPNCIFLIYLLFGTHNVKNHEDWFDSANT